MINWSTERRKVAELRDYPHNPRTFTDKGMADLKRSLESLGYIDPIAINKDGTIIGGHARRQTLLALGLKEVDVRVPDVQLTDKQVKEAVIRLNRNAAGVWDYKLLEEHFDQPDLIEWGFEKSEFNAFGAKEGLTDPDDVPEPPAKPISKLGDIWILGDHRIACGSSTDPQAVTALLAGARPMLMVTDPPYGVNYDPTWRDGKGIFGDGNAKMRGEVQSDDRCDWREAWALFNGDIAYVWHGGLHSGIVAESLTACGFSFRAQIIWIKQHFAFGRGNYHWQHEPCWYVVRDKAKSANWHGGRKQSTVWEITSMNAAGAGHRAEEDEKSNHSTQKPVECMKRPIENNSQPGDFVYEPFSGSGTTIIAAEMTGRKCLAMELNPSYVDMAVIRWQAFTGKVATNAENGDHFASAGKPIKKAKAG
jgi:DNA modification methylase